MDEESLLAYFSEDYSLLIEAGFVAVKQLDEIAARRIFKAAEILNPDNPASQIGLGYIALNKLRVAEAATIFEAVVNKDPKHRLAQALLGVAYLLTQDKKKRGEQLLIEAKDGCDDPKIKNLAEVCLDWMNKDLQAKTLSPVK